MPNRKDKTSLLLTAVGDLMLLTGAFLLSKHLVFQGKSPDLVSYSLLTIIESFLWIILCLKFNLYEIPRIIYTHKILSKNIYLVFVFTILSGGLLFFIVEYKFSRQFFLWAMLFFLTFVIAWRSILISLLVKYRKKGHNKSNILIIGINKNITTLINKVYLKPKYGFHIAGIFTDVKVNDELTKYYKGNLSQIKRFLENSITDEIIISLPYQYSNLINELFSYADNNMIRVSIIPEFSEYLPQSFSIDYLQNIPVLKLRSEPLNSITNRIIKRLFDIVFSLLVIVFLFSWLFPSIALIIKLTSKGPVFFVQDRTGKNGVPFKCFKFRSMTVNSESDNLQATKNDARVTKFGAFMRKTSIDELPQIFNVLFNKMSLVGPRPHMLKHTEQYRVLVDKFMVRHLAKPGVTGWAQINGYRGETKLVKDMENRANADIWYVENWSFLLDMKIIFKTAWSMFFKIDENAF